MVGGDALGDFGEEGVHQVGHDQPDHEGAPRRQAARHPVGLVIQLLDAGQHAAAGFRPTSAHPRTTLETSSPTLEILRDILQAHRGVGEVGIGSYRSVGEYSNLQS